MANKSKTCIGKATGRPVMQYWSESEACEGAEHLFNKCNKRMKPYRCGRCEYWHLSPMARETPSFKCHSCTGRDGNPKATYRSESKARQRAGILRDEQGAELEAYPCPCGPGWHLTKAADFRWTA